MNSGKLRKQYVVYIVYFVSIKIIYLCVMLEWTDLSDNDESYSEGIDEDGNFEMSDKLYRKFAEKTMQVIRKVEEIGLPKKGWQTRIITMKAFNSVAIIKLIADKESISSAKLVIFAINQKAARTLIELKEGGRLNNCRLVISDIRNAGIKDKSKAVTMLEPHFKIDFLKSHAKISVLETRAGNYYTIEGSGNFSYNARLEQYIIDNDKRLFDFSEEWIKEIQKIV